MLRPPTEDCFEILDIDAGGVPARMYRAAPGLSPPGLLVWFHGGGWVLGDIDTHDNVCRTLNNRTGHTVLSVDYRLAPEDPFPAGLDDCVRATEWAFENTDVLGVDAERIAVGGDSAGGNLAAVVCHVLSGAAPIRFQLLVYPVTDARAGTPSYTENAEGYFLTASGMQWFIDQYLTDGVGTRDDPRVSPMCAAPASLAGSPPALVITAGFDPLRDEGVSYAERLSEAGVVTTHVHFPGQIHGFFSMPEFLSDARVAHAIAAEALLAALR